MDLERIAARLAEVDGVVGVCLGGSRARGTHLPGSDVDLGLYYDRPLDVAALRALAGPDHHVTEPGEWGPWVDGGAWLTVDDSAVDWIFRELDRVERVWADCVEGKHEVATQVGHPLGFHSHAYIGELALGVPLADPTGRLAAVRDRMREYPPALREKLVGEARWGCGFHLDVAAKGAKRGDAAYVAACLAQVFGALAHAIHADAGRWLINEKGAIAESDALPAAPERFAERTNALFGHLGDTPDELATAIKTARQLVEEALHAL
jgi:hypothetical protein